MILWFHLTPAEIWEAGRGGTCITSSICSSSGALIIDASDASDTTFHDRLWNFLFLVNFFTVVTIISSSDGHGLKVAQICSLGLQYFLEPHLRLLLSLIRLERQGNLDISAGFHPFPILPI